MRILLRMSSAIISMMAALAATLLCLKLSQTIWMCGCTAIAPAQDVATVT
ncbi:hypothetical protein [Thermodesulforhabdus norvegica]|nr:hypothetical protein [Thermodesulforhabdus norvegica]